MIVTCPECATRYDVADKAFSSGGRAVRCNHCACEWYQIGPSGGRGSGAMGDAPRDRSDLGRGASSRGRFGDREDERRLPLERDDRLQDDWGEEIYPDDGWDQRRGLPAPSGGQPSTALRTQEGGRRAQRGRRAGAASGRQSRGGARPQRRVTLTSLLFPLSGVALAGLVAGALFMGPTINESISARSPSLTQTESIETASSAAVSSPAPKRAVTDGLVFVEFKYDLVERAEGPALEVWGRVANNSAEEALSPTIEIVSKDKEGKALQRWLAQPEVESIGPGESARFSSRMMYPLEPVHDVEFYIAAR